MGIGRPSTAAMRFPAPTVTARAVAAQTRQACSRRNVGIDKHESRVSGFLPLRRSIAAIIQTAREHRYGTDRPLLKPLRKTPYNPAAFFQLQKGAQFMLAKVTSAALVGLDAHL